MIRTILSPGVELNEVDKSQYNPTTIDTFRVLLPGFASKGKIALPTTITSMTQFKDEFGVPTNEAERYAFNAANIIMNDGGEVVFARLPYSESANYPCTTYTVGDAAAVSGELSVLSATDPSITSANTITMSDTAMLDVSEYIDLAASQGIGTNDIKIVDITRSEYATYTSEGSKINCLGILPVITTAANALAIASQLPDLNMYNITDTTIDAINAFESLSAVRYIKANDPLTFANTSNNWLVPVNSIVGANTQQSISKNAAEFFPTISYFAGSDQTDTNTTVYDKSYFSYIGVVVYKLEVDSATGCLQATPVEAFAGSVIKDAVDIRTNASTYIENVVNNTSKYIKLYANVSDDTIQDSILYAEPSVGTILGNAPVANTAKTIKFADITSNLDDILNSQSNILANTIDVVCDAGVSTIGQFVTYSSDQSSTIPADGEYVRIVRQPLSTTVQGGSAIELSISATSSGEHTYQWYLDGVELVGKTDSTLKISNVYPNITDGNYTCKVTSESGLISKTSNIATVTVMTDVPWVEIVQQPLLSTTSAQIECTDISAEVEENEELQFTISALGTADISYQWYFYEGAEAVSGQPVALALSIEGAVAVGENEPTLAISSLNSTNVGAYYCEVTQSDGEKVIDSQTVTITNISGTTYEVTSYPKPTNADYIDTPRKISISTPRAIGDAASFDPDNTTISAVTADTTAAWRAIVDKIKGFCQNTRKDCVFITESPRHFSIKGRNKIVDGTNSSITVGKNITPNIRYISGINSSYGWGYAVWYRIADAHSGKLFWMPPSAFGTGVYVRTRRNFNVWDAPAGINRATISVADTSFEPDLQARNALYSNAWNYSLTYVNQGTVLEGQKTFQTKPSAFDRINVRSLFIYLERRVFNIARNYIYEPNTAYTRQQFVDSVKPMFESVKAAGGLYDFRIIADETLNTPDVIDNNEFRIRIGIRPTRTIEFIMIEFVALRTGSTFTELV